MAVQWIPAADGVYNGTELKDKTVSLRKENGTYICQGSVTTPVLEVAPFTELVVSWNGFTPPGTSLIVETQVRVGEEWSRWYGLASWNSWGKPSSMAPHGDHLAKVDIDTVVLIPPYLANAVRVRVTLRTENENETPTLTAVYAATRTGLSDEEPLPLSFAEVDLLVPPRSQMVEDKSIANSVCSPTSVGMVMAYYGVSHPTAVLAGQAYDHRAEIFGNWSFAAALAGSYGLSAYVDFLAGLGPLYREIAAGHPVVCSVRWKEGELTNAPIPKSNGHLLVVRGFAMRNGRPVVIVNDPAAPEPETVCREYDAAEFRKIWRGVVYRIFPKQ